MCGRFLVDEDTAREINRIIRTTEDKIRQAAAESELRLSAKDIHPAGSAPILVAGNLGISYEWQHWGLQGRQQPETRKSGTLIFNARSETALERPMFKDSVLHRRAVIPASGFYEWNHQKEKHIFTRKDAQVLFMAGFYKLTEKGKCFVILTTQANASMEPVHERMPLILEEDEINDWIYQDSKTEEFLHKMPCQLECRAEYRQLGLFE